MNLLYLTNSFYNSRNANTIQTKSMSDALGSHVNYICTVYREKGWFSIKHITENNKDIYVLTLPDLMLSALIYSLISFFIGVKVLLKKSVDAVYARNINVACLFSLVFGAKTVIEIHAPLSISGSIFMRLASYFRDIKIVSITFSLKRILEKKNKLSNDIIVIPDAHNVSESVIDNLSLISEDELVNKYKRNPFHLGYFGSIKDYKGAQLLFDMIDKLEDCDFSIYTKDVQSVVMRENIREIRFLDNKQAIERMRCFSALLLLLKQTNKYNDISGFTSPLKLFEYLASGVPIIATRSLVLEEVLEDKVNCFMVDDNIDSVRKMIDYIRCNPNHVYKVVQNALNDSKRYTYNRRAEHIIKYVLES